MRKVMRKLWYYVKKIPLVDPIYKKLYWNNKVRKLAEKRNKEISNNGFRYIQLVNDIFKGRDAVCFVFAGTLLGIIRDKGFIKWDVDLDFGVLINERFGWSDLENLMKKNNYRKVREFKYDGKVTEQTYMINHLTIDFFGVFVKEDYSIFYSYDWIPGIRYKSIDEMSVYRSIIPCIDNYIYVLINEYKIPVPNCPEKILEAIYNEDWMIPNPNWKANSGKNCQLLVDCYGYREVFGGEA